MLNIEKIKLNKIINFLSQTPLAIVERAFLSFLLLFLISLIAGGIIFYKYNILIKKKEIAQFENPPQFKEKIYENVLKIWQEREVAFEIAGTKKYFDIFKPKPSAIPASNPNSNDYFLFKFYESRGQILPSIEERSLIWEEFGFGTADSYAGTFSQNQKLLEALKQELQ